MFFYFPLLLLLVLSSDDLTATFAFSAVPHASAGGLFRIFVLAEGLCALGDTGKECFRGAWLVSEGCILCSRQSFCEVGYC
jgi:hypothetical protein